MNTVGRKRQSLNFFVSTKKEVPLDITQIIFKIESHFIIKPVVPKVFFMNPPAADGCNPNPARLKF